MRKKPKIGIAGGLLTANEEILAGAFRTYVNHNYVRALEKAGAVPVLLPVLADPDDLPAQLEGLDGLLVPGGADIDPVFYGEQPRPRLGATCPASDRRTLALIAAADAAGLPILGICRGAQAINVAFGGTLYQDQESEIPGCLKHVQQSARQQPSHAVTLAKGSFLARIFGTAAQVNSFHHQSVKQLAPGFAVTARADDGVVEGIERCGAQKNFVCGVQFHPEMMAEADCVPMQTLFDRFVSLCAGEGGH